jgi:DNA invertase Pin-like site-specific DNA recombinase
MDDDAIRRLIDKMESDPEQRRMLAEAEEHRQRVRAKFAGRDPIDLDNLEWQEWLTVHDRCERDKAEGRRQNHRYAMKMARRAARSSTPNDPGPASTGYADTTRSTRRYSCTKRAGFCYIIHFPIKALEANETQGASMGKILGYARISSDQGQDLASQKAMLEKLGAIVVFADTGNGSSLQGRDQLETALRLLEPQDQLIALHPDRLARDTADLLNIGKRVIERKAVLRIHDPNIVLDGSDMMGEVMLTIFGLVGSVEKHFIRARQRRGIEAAKARNVYKGRPATIDPQRVRELHQQGHGATHIARTLGIGRASVYRLLAA